VHSSSANYNQQQQQRPPQAPLPPVDYGQLQQQQQRQITIQGNSAASQQIQQPPPDPACNMQQLQQSLSTQQTTTTSQQVQQAVNIQEGGTARQQAASQGSQTLARFDEMISRQLLATDSCPQGYGWIRTRHGYLCGRAHHYVRHSDVDKWALSGGNTPLRVLSVNTNGQIGAAVERYMIKIAVHPPKSASFKTHIAHDLFMESLACQEEHVISNSVCSCVESEGLDRNLPHEPGMPKVMSEEELAGLPESMDRLLPWYDSSVRRDRGLRMPLR